MNTREMVEVSITCPRCYRPVLVRQPYTPTATGIAVDPDPVRHAVRLHVTRGCEAA